MQCKYVWMGGWMHKVAMLIPVELEWVHRTDVQERKKDSMRMLGRLWSRVA